MKILINTSILRFGGAVQVALSFINECKYFTQHEFHIIVGRGVNKSLKREEFSSNFHFYDFDHGPVSIWKIPRLAKRLSKMEAEIQPDCVITTSGPSYWHSQAPQLMGYNLGLYIYTDSPFLKTLSIYRLIRYKIIRKIHFYFFRRDATAYLVQTDDVNERVKKFLNTDKVYTVNNTFNGFYNNPVKVSNKLPAKRAEEIRLLTFTSYYSHKNLDIIPLVLDELKSRGYENVSFILTIDQCNYERIFGKKYIGKAINVGYVKPEEGPGLYSECDIMFLPTLSECFSASYPEAMVMKKPIITTDLGFARIICDNAAIYYEAMNHTAAADAVEMLINDHELREKLIENGIKRLKHFNSASERAKKILKICEGLVSDK